MCKGGEMCKVYFIILGLFLFGCVKKPVKIGVILPLSGALSSYGEMCWKGIKLAEKVINEAGGVKGRQIELLLEDAEMEGKALAAIEKLDKQGVVAVIGPLTTKSVIEIGEYANNAKLPVITPTATGAEATKGREWVWRISFTDQFQGQTLAKFATQQLNVTSVCILLDINEPYSAGLSGSFEQEFTDRGGRVLSKTTFTTGDTIFDDQLNVIKGYAPDCIFVPTFYKEAGLIIQRARDMGIAQPFIGGDGWDSPELQRLIGDRPGPNYYTTPFFYSYGGMEVQEFLQRFKNEYEIDPHTFSALGHDVLMVIQECLNLTKKVTRSEFKENIGKVKIEGATGTIDFVGAKDPKRSLILLKFEPGVPVEIMKVVAVF